MTMEKHQIDIDSLSKSSNDVDSISISLLFLTGYWNISYDIFAESFQKHTIEMWKIETFLKILRNNRCCIDFNRYLINWKTIKKLYTRKRETERIFFCIIDYFDSLYVCVLQDCTYCTVSCILWWFCYLLQCYDELNDKKLY